MKAAEILAPPPMLKLVSANLKIKFRPKSNPQLGKLPKKPKKLKPLRPVPLRLARLASVPNNAVLLPPPKQPESLLMPKKKKPEPLLIP
jgi:hypothetical protein